MFLFIDFLFVFLSPGWAFESRVYAEDPYRGFLPSIGPLVTYVEPTSHVKVDKYGLTALSPRNASSCSHNTDFITRIDTGRLGLIYYFHVNIIK